MRYSIISRQLNISQLQLEVRKCGGRNLKVAPASKQIFCDLDDSGVNRLKSLGCSVTKVGGVRADIMPPVVTPPTPVAAAPVYSPEELIRATGLEELRSVSEPPLYGEGINLAIIDSGIRETHQKIGGRVIYRKNFTSDPMRDGLDHGTGVCGIALILAPLCNILNLKVLNDEGEGTEEDVALAIDDCITLQITNPEIAPAVINLSLGGPDDGNPDNPLRVACRAAIDKGIAVLASAGNSGPIPYSVTCPACEKYVGAVGSAKYYPEESTFAISDWSSRGPTLEGLIKPDVVMFGEDISVASSASDTATIAKSGTSFATPFVSSIMLIFYEGVAKQAVMVEPIVRMPIGLIIFVPIEYIMDTSLSKICIKPQNVPPGKDTDYGYGIPYGPIMVQVMRAVPLMDISTIMGTITPVIGLAMLGMIIIPMAEEIK